MVTTWYSDLERSLDVHKSNLVLSGLYLHLLRKPALISPSFPSLFSTITKSTFQECLKSRFSSLTPPCSSAALFAAGPSLETSTTQPFSADPVFNSLSSLYKPALSVSDWYNISSKDEVNQNTGLPFGFFHHPVQGYQDGYPLLISSYLSRKRAVDTLDMMRDAGYFDPSASQSVSLELLTYNRNARSFGYLSGALDWLGGGKVELTLKFSSFPALNFYWGDKTIDAAYPIVYVCLTALYVVVTFYFIVSALSIEKTSRWTITGEKLRTHERDAVSAKLVAAIHSKRQEDLNFFEEKNRQLIAGAKITSWKPTTGWFDFFVESCICTLMIASVVIYFSFANQLTTEREAFNSRTVVYDADSSSPCRYHLLQRARNDSSPLPGLPGSWALPRDASGLHEMTRMLRLASSLENLWSIYR